MGVFVILKISPIPWFSSAPADSPRRKRGVSEYSQKSLKNLTIVSEPLLHPPLGKGRCGRDVLPLVRGGIVGWSYPTLQGVDRWDFRKGI